MPRFMVEEDLRSGRLVSLPIPGLTPTVRFGAAWLRGRVLGGAGEKFVALLHAHDGALQGASAWVHSPP
jgi:DNA-binding transcriptional LysR family regulator